MMRFYEIPASLSAEIDDLEKLIVRYRRGELEGAQFRAHRVPFGIYEQRKADTYMVRIRCTGGGITPAQLQTVALLARQYGAEELHITTRQEVQIHDVSLEDVPVILRALLQANLSTRGGGGNTVRNVMVSWDAGIAPAEPFDVTPYAVSLTSMLIAEPDSWTLPRKFKFAFSNTEADNSSCAFTDVGFIAVIRDGVRGFKVYVAGGMGAKPQVGHLLHSFVPVSDIYRIATAIKKIFDRHGNRKNKHAARLRFLWNKLGEAKFRELYEETLREIGDAPLRALPEINNEPGAVAKASALTDTPAFALWQRRFVQPQQQAGLYSVLLPVPLGQFPWRQAQQLAAMLADYGENVLRFTRDQNISLRNIPASCLGDIYAAVKDFSELSALPKFYGACIACTGADTCKLGICLPRGALTALTKKLLSAGLDLDALGEFRLNISGCPNTCGVHMTADLGFYGQVGRKEQRMYPAYGIVAGGRIGGENPRLATRLDSVSARDLPDFVADFLAIYLGKRERYASFAQYLDAEGKSDIQNICDKYRHVPNFEDDKNYYFDWGAAEIFSLIGKGVGECSAGLFDLIDLDLQAIHRSKQELAALPDPAAVGELLYDIVLRAARMLLITKGGEARSDAEVFAAFRKYFVEAHLVEQRFLPLLKAAGEKDIAALAALAGEVYALAEAVEKLYEGMDDSLKFQPEKPTAAPAAAVPEAVAKPALSVAAVKDLRGVVCPMNFVKTKLELAKIGSGQTLQIFLDDGEPIDNVPRSVAEEGHKILEMNRMADYWSVLIEKA